MIRVPTIFDFDQGNRKLDAVSRAGVRPAKARRIEANIAKLPELLPRET
jgi:hypothetical protein